MWSEPIEFTWSEPINQLALHGFHPFSKKIEKLESRTIWIDQDPNRDQSYLAVCRLVLNCFLRMLKKLHAPE